MIISSFISGCAGLRLSAAEKKFFTKANPWGLILFGRNIDNPEQVKALTAEFRAAVGRDNVPILIDQEGGRVQRLRPPHWRSYPKGENFHQLDQVQQGAGERLAYLAARLIAYDLTQIGINVDCLPILDVRVENSTPAIGDRSYGYTVSDVVKYGAAVTKGLKDGGVLPVIKHLPGHGRASVDSHVDLPKVSEDRSALSTSDFDAFRPFKDEKIGMTAHIIYEQIDSDNPATQSKIVINDIIRTEIGFDGLLLTDDLSMGALSGTVAEKCQRSLEAGCDIILHCNGEMDEMIEVAANVPTLSGTALRRVNAAMESVIPAVKVDEQLLVGEFNQLMQLLG